MDPYTLLNVPENATEEEIQKSYKYCSRSFHPDKQPPTPEKKQAAQQVFVEFKNAYDILNDPVLRFAYDEYGHYGVHFIIYLRKNKRRNTTNAAKRKQEQSHGDLIDDEHSVIALITALLQRGDKETAYCILTDSLEYYQYKQWERANPFFCNMEFQCTTLHTQIFSEGIYPTIFPEVEKSAMSFIIKIPPPSNQAGEAPSPTTTSTHQNKIHGKESVLSKLEYELGGSCEVKDGKGKLNGKVGVQYEPVSKTNVKCEINDILDSEPKLSINTSRVMSSGTVMMVEAISSIKNKQRQGQNKSDIGQTKPMMDPVALSFTTKRVLYEGKLFGAFSIGMGSNRTFHYTQFSVTSLYPNFPRCSFTFNLGADRFPLQFHVNHDLRLFHFSSSSSSSTASSSYNDRGYNETDDSSDRNRTTQNKPTLLELLQNVAKDSNDRDSQTGQTYIKFGFNGSIQWKTIFTRTLSQTTNLTLGIQHMAQKGLAFIFGLDRGCFYINIPIWITSSPASSPMYPMKVLYTCLWTILLNESITELIENSQLAFLRSGGESSTNAYGNDEDWFGYNNKSNSVDKRNRMEEELLQKEKVKKDALEQKKFMIPQAERKKLLEERKGGLVIMKATYMIEFSVEPNCRSNRDDDYSDSKLDVTTQLQFWVVNSTLKLPASSKSHMLGFYDIRSTSNTSLSTINTNGSSFFTSSPLWLCHKIRWNAGDFNRNAFGSKGKEQNTVKLTVRYKFRDSVYEITVKDEDALILPCDSALKLGKSELVS